MRGWGVKISVRVLAVAVLVAMVFAAQDGFARKRSTKRGNVSLRSTHNQDGVVVADSIIVPDSMQVGCFGYDKPLRSSRECFFVSNNTGFDITCVFFTAQYIDTKGRQFHEVSNDRRVDIPDGETRQITFPSWDKQQSFYYVGSTRSRASGTPYNIRISIDSISVSTSSGDATH